MKLETLNFIYHLLQAEVGRRTAALSEARKTLETKRGDAGLSHGWYGEVTPDIEMALKQAQNQVDALERSLEDATLAFADFRDREWN